MPITISSLCKRFGDLVVFKDLNLTFQDQAVTAVLGPSGCGKTTLLNIISGVEDKEAGTILGTDKRKISYLFQEPRLLPWKNVYANVEFLLLDIMSPEERKLRVEHFLKLVSLNEFSHYYPHTLSGGMKQRVSMARAFAYPADILLMDEPFQALDLRLKIGLAKSFNMLFLEEERTAVFVTHDIHEALMLGDEIVVFSQRPGEVRDRIINPVPRRERSLSNELLLKIEKRLYTLLR